MDVVPTILDPMDEYDLLRIGLLVASAVAIGAVLLGTRCLIRSKPGTAVVLGTLPTAIAVIGDLVIRWRFPGLLAEVESDADALVGVGLAIGLGRYWIPAACAGCVGLGLAVLATVKLALHRIRGGDHQARERY